MNFIGCAGLLGPVRRRRPGVYSATCPACRRCGALTIRVLPAGDRPSCRHCLTVDVVNAFRRLDQPLAKEPA